MSARASPTIVGGFLLGALALAVALVMIFGGGLFKTRIRYVVYFEGNVTGLAVGGPVMLRGVPVGTVESIRVEVNRQSRSVFIPVYILVDPSTIMINGRHLPPSGEVAASDIEEAIRMGLRARLQTQSLVTGQLGVEFELLPDTPARLVGLDKSVTELPTVPSVMETWEQRLEKLPIEQIAGQFLKMVTDIDALVASPDTRAALASLTRTSDAIGATMRNDVPPTLQTLNRTASDLDLAIRQTHTTLAAIDSIVEPNTPARANIEQMLRDLAITAQSLKGLAEELERNPNALIMRKR
jgi:paraquat-inducible protein B